MRSPLSCATAIRLSRLFSSMFLRELLQSQRKRMQIGIAITDVIADLLDPLLRQTEKSGMIKLV